MDSTGFSTAFTNWIETLPDRPLLLLLFIMAGAMLFLPLGILLRKLASLLVDKTMGAIGGAGDEEMAKLSAVVYGGADADGRIDGVPARFTTGPMIVNGKITGYEAEFRYAVANPLGLKLVVHRAGLLNRPLEFLPPEVPEVPENLKAAGYTLRCDPPELAGEAARKAAAFAPFAAGGALTELTLTGGELRAGLSAREDWPDEDLRALLKAGAAAARGFN